MSTTTVSPVEFATVASASPEPTAQESPMRTTLSAVRPFVLAFLILAGSLGAAVLGPAHDAAAAGPCTVTAKVESARGTNGYLYVFGRGSTQCAHAATQSIGVYLYAGGTLVATGGGGPAMTAGFWYSNTGTVWARCGVTYQAATVHAFHGYYNTTTWGSPVRFC